MSAPRALASRNEPLPPGTRIRSPKQVRITSSCASAIAAAVVDPPHRDHAHRAARAVHELDRLGQVVVHAVAVDRVGVAAAHLHDLVVAIRVRCAAAMRRASARASSGSRYSSTYFTCMLLDRSTSATPACTSTRSPGATGPTSRSRPARPAVVVPTAAASPSTDTTSSATATSPHVMHTSSRRSPASTVIRSATPGTRPARRRSPAQHDAGPPSPAPPRPRRSSTSRSRRGSAPSRRRTAGSSSSSPMLMRRTTPVTSTLAR